jgi:hypothetical protein
MDNKKYVWRQLGNAIQLRSAQDTVLWSIFGVFWAANAILLVALFPKGGLPAYPIGAIISVVGFLLGIVWYKIQGRALGHVTRYERLMKRLEEELGFDSEEQRKYAISAEINKEDYRDCLDKGVSARVLMPKCAKGACLFWALAFISFLTLFSAKLVCERDLLKMLFS